MMAHTLSFLALAASAMAQTTSITDFFDPFTDRPFSLEASVETVFTTDGSFLAYTVNCAQAQAATDVRCSKYPVAYMHINGSIFQGLYPGTPTSTGFLCELGHEGGGSMTDSAVCGYTYWTDVSKVVSTTTTTLNGCQRVAASGALIVTSAVDLLPPMGTFALASEASSLGCPVMTTPSPASTPTGTASSTMASSTGITTPPSGSASAASSAATTTSGAGLLRIQKCFGFMACLTSALLLLSA
jgi:hypothetical protein